MVSCVLGAADAASRRPAPRVEPETPDAMRGRVSAAVGCPRSRDIATQPGEFEAWHYSVMVRPDSSDYCWRSGKHSGCAGRDAPLSRLRKSRSWTPRWRRRDRDRRSEFLGEDLGALSLKLGCTIQKSRRYVGSRDRSIGKCSNTPSFYDILQRLSLFKVLRLREEEAHRPNHPDCCANSVVCGEDNTFFSLYSGSSAERFYVNTSRPAP